MQRLARVFGWLLRFNDVARITRTNLAACFPELSAKELDSLRNDSLMHMSMIFFELGQLSYWSVDELIGDAIFEGEETLVKHLHAGQGVILLVPHLGAWELLNVYLGTKHSVAALYDRPRQQGVEAAIKTARQRFEGEMYPIGVAGMRSVIKELRAGRLVAILPDQVPEKESGEYAPFFGQPALTMTLPFQLADKTGARLLLGVVERVTDGPLKYRFRFSELAPAMSDSLADRVAAMNASIEAAVLECPEQYQWEYKRFKRPPEGGQDNIYRRQ